jgi:hypothetical protein
MRRRRRNPVAVDSMMKWGLWLVGGYVFIKYILPMIQGIGQAGSNAVNAITSPIANLFPGTSPSVQVLNTVLMPDGTTFPASSLTSLNFQTINGQAQFTYNGAQYALTPQVNGVYQAIAL